MSYAPRPPLKPAEKYRRAVERARGAVLSAPPIPCPKGCGIRMLERDLAGHLTRCPGPRCAP